MTSDMSLQISDEDMDEFEAFFDEESDNEG